MADGVCIVIGAGPGLGMGLARRFAREGYPAIVNVNGPIREDTHFSPDLIAEQFWQLHCQPPGAAGAEVEYT